MGNCKLITGLLLAVSTAAAAAQSGVVAFSRIDSDRNGYVSRVEARPVVERENFDAVDANNDGLLNRDEYTALRNARSHTVQRGR